MTKKELKEMLSLHQKWLNNEPGGVRANLANANLYDADLQWVNLEGANLKGANLKGANLKGANLKGANLVLAYLNGANLANANLQGANLASANLVETHLKGANLKGANLEGANLKGANLAWSSLYSADLFRANLDQAKLPKYQIPQNKKLIVYKKVESNIVLKLEIPAKAKRTASLVGNKCRAEYAKVIAWKRVGGKWFKTNKQNVEFISKHDCYFQYKLGEIARPDSYDDNPCVECTNGIHFFMKYEDAEKYC
jgi:hypothetical protein